MATAEFTADPLHSSAVSHPDKTAVVELATGRRLSYRELDALVDQAAGWLTATLGAPVGARIAFLGRNGITPLAMGLGAERCGAIFVPLNWRLAAAEIAALVSDCAPALAVADAEFAAALADATSTSDAATAIAARPAAPQADLDPGRPAILLYTSGTTGRPRGVVVTALNANAASLNFALVGDVEASSVLLSDLPMFHTIGLVAVARTALMRGGTLVLIDRFATGRTLAALADAGLGVTHYFAVPVMVDALERDPAFDPPALARLRAIFVGGAPLSPALAERFLGHGVALVNGYGMSEAGTVMHMPIEHDAVRRSAGAVGLPAPHIEVRLVGEGRDVVDGAVGEVWLRGPSVTPGYWRRPDETSAAFSDGWFRTGDLGRRDRDGFYRIVDRLKDMYVSGGENVYPAEVEAALLRAPGVADAAVLGMPDPRWGETGLAFVVMQPDAPFDATALATHCLAWLARYKCPARIIPVPLIPRSAAGKILKPVLRERLNRGDFA